MKRDLLAELFCAFDEETKPLEQTAASLDKFKQSLPEISFTDRQAGIIRQVFADYEDEEKYEIPW